ncbi:TetR/AcrR family transcriptional regulator [Planotetraspora sp. A-T 1434]|uniref:TetR/AcrR family transcriptional regulator n=1 Tax=Planotetraspora sp. A-T 1434 TaxID=2979219 RepID=UPI0021C11A4F|nr:TetR/AcrR family transcriptional regulator [Planotetraspora sp. A-T 1434]MCT9930394.1 TetR/AcrR family transcriptional regulator [Planotetraspora sp. A-T 1434]
MAADRARGLRSDAQRNAERLLEVATHVFAEQGPEAPVSEIARAAGVGTATLYRRFPTRQALLAAVYAGHVQALAARADELAVSSEDPLRALVGWLHEFAGLLTEHRGMKGLITGRYEGDAELFRSCRRSLSLAVDSLLRPAQQARAIRPDVDAERTLTLINAVVLAAGQAGNNQDETNHLIDLVISGFRYDDRN